MVEGTPTPPAAPVARAASPEDHAAFWAWWDAAAERLLADVSEEEPAGFLGRILGRGARRRGMEAALAEVDDALERIHPALYADHGPSGWVFTALGERRAWRALVRLARACPAGVPDRPTFGAPRWRRASITVGGHTFLRSHLRWVSVLRDRGLILGVVVRPPTPADGQAGPTEAEIHHAVGRFVVNELGEATALRLQEWRVISTDSRSAQASRPWDDLLPRLVELLDGNGVDAVTPDPA